jgi:antitoxin YefM
VRRSGTPKLQAHTFYNFHIITTQHQFLEKKSNIFGFFRIKSKKVRKFIQISVRIMLVANISDFRKDIKTYLDKVSQNLETLVINRGKKQGIVVMSLDEYNGLMATHHELSSKINQARLDSAIQKLNHQGFEKQLMED